jgi:Tol biopolymer transport system component
MTGRTLLHYRILENLGQGGMGVVYKALDTHLDRLVAVKVLPPEKVADVERKRRFVQEAKSASALNHPNIITIYDIASEDGVDFIAMEYVPGKALNRLISRKGLAVSDVLRYAIQISDALAAAHAAGIIHRDLKPGNVMIRDEAGRPGLVKVLDFGLAKLTEKVESGDRELTETMRQQDAPDTAGGVVLGTVSYMSPEQAQGKKLDGRSDIFSFGAMLYEMVTGRRAFQGDSDLSTLSAILRDEPKPASQVVEGVPRELERIINRCLRKSPERRFQNMADLKVALEELKEESDSGTLGVVSAVPRRHRRRLAWAVALLAIMAIVAGALWFVRSRSKAPEAALTPVPLTTYPAFQSGPSFSPDGNQVAFTWNGEKQDNFDVYVKLIGTAGPPLRLTTDPFRDYGPAWSPDGRHIAFLRDLGNGKAAVLLVPALGGPEHKVVEVYSQGLELYSLGAGMSNVPGPYLSWLPDSNSLVVSDRGSSRSECFALFLLSIETGEKRRLTSPSAQLLGDSGPSLSPDGRMLAFTRNVDPGFSDLFLLALSNGLKPLGEPTRLTFGNRTASGPTWTADGHEVVFADLHGWDLWRVAVRTSTRRPDAPRRLESLGQGISQPAISRRGSRLVYTHQIFHASIGRIGAPGRRSSSALGANGLRTLISSTRNDISPQFSPDGNRVAFVSTRSGHPEIWVCNSDGSNAVQLTSFAGPLMSTPRWSPDGQRIAFDSDAAGEWDIYVVGANGGKPQRMTAHPANDGDPSWSHDGQWIYFDSARAGAQQVFKIPANGGEAIQVTRDGGFAPLESPDGKSLYYTKALAATSLWKIPAEGGQGTKILDGLSSYLSLAIADAGVYFVPLQKPTLIQFLSFASNQIRSVVNLEKPIEAAAVGSGLALSPDGRWILFTQFDQAGSELMLVENFH